MDKEILRTIIWANYYQVDCEIKQHPIEALEKISDNLRLIKESVDKEIAERQKQ